MSHADTASNTIRGALRKLYSPIQGAGVAYVNAHRAAVEAADVVEVMQATVATILAIEHLKEMAEEAEKTARALLCEQMSETGATTIQTDGQMAYISRKPAWVSIDQEDMLPPEYMRQPPPAPDKKAIKAAIEKGNDVPGCTLVRPNDYSLVIRGKQ